MPLELDHLSVITLHGGAVAWRGGPLRHGRVAASGPTAQSGGAQRQEFYPQLP